MKLLGSLLCLTSCSWWVLFRVCVLTTTCTAQCCDLMHKWPRQRRHSSGTGVFGIFFILSPKGKLWMDIVTAAGQVSSTKAVVNLLMPCLPSMETSLESLASQDPRWARAHQLPYKCLELIQFRPWPCLNTLPPYACQNAAMRTGSLKIWCLVFAASFLTSVTFLRCCCFLHSFCLLLKSHFFVEKKKEESL